MLSCSRLPCITSVIFFLPRSFPLNALLATFEYQPLREAIIRKKFYFTKKIANGGGVISFSYIYFFSNDGLPNIRDEALIGPGGDGLVEIVEPQVNQL